MFQKESKNGGGGSTIRAITLDWFVNNEFGLFGVFSASYNMADKADVN